MTRDIDTNGDRLIDFAEFCTLMSRVKRHRLLHLMFRAAQFVVPRSKRVEPFSYLQKYRCCPPPIFMAIISLIQARSFFKIALKIVIYIYYTVDYGGSISFTGPVPTKSVLIFNPYRKEELWRFITYMFIHIGLYHVLFNVLAQLLLGIPLELVHQWRVIVIYLAGVLSGSLLVSVVDRNVFLAGASGGVYALLAAHLAELIINWSEMEFNWIRAIVLSIMVASDAAISLYQRYFVDRTDRVSYVSHIGGFLAGIFLGVVVLRNFRFHRWERKLWWASLIAFIVFLVICIIFTITPYIL
ncbi:peptidase, S54 family [Dictyocaulus viviparus]|uniref:Peptidase, S54 family n=1 Tax=Dictyocaulus viviparus TaxID=29172 RepID=A0A0D8XH22_DICVI|nr:peptidase, S54 family [Dictyocaulus viviparus]